MTRTIAALAGIAAAATAVAQETASVVAFETGTIQVTGPRGPDLGDRFFNIQGVDVAEQFRSYGVARWDLADVRAQFDAAFPDGWVVTALALEMTQDNAGFTTDGDVEAYFSTDDTADIKTLLSDLFYPFFDNAGEPDLPLGNPDPFLSYLFFEVATGTIDRYDQDGGPGGASERLDLIDEIKADLESDSLHTWVFVDASGPVSATYRGQDPFEGREGPKLFITAEAAGGDPCRADLDGDGSLTIFDFLEFQNFFDAGDPIADFDGDGDLTIFDFLAFQNEFDLGCP